MPLGTEIGLGPGDIVLRGDPVPPKQGTAPISVHVYCGKTARWTKIPLGMEVGLGPGDLVLDGDPAPPAKKMAQPQPIFGPCLLWPNGWMDEDATSYGSRPRPRPHCVRRRPSSPQRGTAAPPFGPCLLWPRSPISDTAEL